MIKFKNLLLGQLLVALLFTASCSKESNDPVSTNSLIEISNDVPANSARISDNSKTRIFPMVKYGPQKGAVGSSIDIGTNDNLKLIAEVASPISAGNTLQASFVTVNGNTAYVGYNTRGDAYLGGIDVIDITDPSNPIVLQAAILKNIDVSVLKYENNKLYFGGARNVDAFTNVLLPAFIGAITLDGNKLTTDVQLKELGSYVTNSITINGNDLIATTGNNGAVYVIDKLTLEIKNSNPLDGLKDAITNSQNYVALAGAYDGSPNQTILSFSKSTNQQVSSWNLPTGIYFDARSNIADYQDNLLVANGYAGISYLNLSNGNLFDHIGLPDSMVGVDPADIYCNAVSNDGTYIYAANGAGGLGIAEISAGNTFNIIGKAELSSSANFVVASGDYIYVASGTEGMKILKLEPKDNPGTSIDCDSRPELNSNQNGSYIVNSGDEQYFQSPDKYGKTKLDNLQINSGGLFDFCGTLEIDHNITIDGILYIRGDLKVKQNVTINGNGTLKIEGNVTIDKNLDFNGTIDFVTPECTFEVKGNLNKNGGATVVNPQNNNGPTIIP